MDRVTNITWKAESGVRFGGFDYEYDAMGRKGKKRATRANADLLDEHYYEPPAWMLGAAHRYDAYDRRKPGVFIGEYACHWEIKPGSRPNVLWTAICEAAAMTGFERNSDVVRMASYAPLFGRAAHSQWRSNLIWFNGVKSWSMRAKGL